MKNPPRLARAVLRRIGHPAFAKYVDQVATVTANHGYGAYALCFEDGRTLMVDQADFELIDGYLPKPRARARVKMYRRARRL